MKEQRLKISGLATTIYILTGIVAFLGSICQSYMMLSIIEEYAGENMTSADSLWPVAALLPVIILTLAYLHLGLRAGYLSNWAVSYRGSFGNHLNKLLSLMPENASQSATHIVQLNYVEADTYEHDMNVLSDQVIKALTFFVDRVAVSTEHLLQLVDGEEIELERHDWNNILRQQRLAGELSQSLIDQLQSKDAEHKQEISAIKHAHTLEKIEMVARNIATLWMTFPEKKKSEKDELSVLCRTRQSLVEQREAMANGLIEALRTQKISADELEAILKLIEPEMIKSVANNWATSGMLVNVTNMQNVHPHGQRLVGFLGLLGHGQVEKDADTSP